MKKMFVVVEDNGRQLKSRRSFSSKVEAEKFAKILETIKKKSGYAFSYFIKSVSR